jgi:ABC-2 type transport system permease protein/oleandomycin transport system permease protein
MSARWVLSDAAAMTRRNLLKYVRVPTLLVFSTIQPVMFVLLFAYIFGGAVNIPGVSYKDFLMPGIFVQTAVFGSMQTGIGLADDITHGMIDRFRSLPMARSAVLAGRTMSDSVRNLFVILLMTGVGYLIGFRFRGGFMFAVAGILLAVLFSHAFSWVSALIGLSIRDVESTQAASFASIFPVVFASSAFVPIATMPGWLQAFAKVNPISLTVNAIRSLTLPSHVANTVQGGTTGTHVWQALMAIGLILAVFVPLAVRAYRKT